MSDPGPKPEKPFSSVLRTGTGAGILVALAVIAVFILAATFLKSLFFGLILACFLLPVEKFFERKVVQTRAVRAAEDFFDWLARPFRRLKMRLSGGRIESRTEICPPAILRSKAAALPHKMLTTRTAMWYNNHVSEWNSLHIL